MFLKVSRLGLPSELWLSVVGYLESTKDISALARTETFTRNLMTVYLYCYDLQLSQPRALLWATWHGKVETVQNSLSAVDRIKKGEKNFEVHTKLNTKGLYGWTPLSRAAQNGHALVVKLLLAREGVDVNCTDYQKETPLMWAARNGHASVVKLLLGRDDPN